MKIYRDYFRKWSGGSSPLKQVSYEDLVALSKQKGKKAITEFKKIEKLKIKQENLQAKIVQLKNDKKSNVISAFITFENKPQRNIIYTAYQKSPLIRCCFTLGCAGKREVNVMEAKFLKVTKPTDPSNIIWHNMNVGGLSKFWRRLISWVITIILWIISKKNKVNGMA